MLIATVRFIYRTAKIIQPEEYILTLQAVKYTKKYYTQNIDWTNRLARLIIYTRPLS